VLRYVNKEYRCRVIEGFVYADYVGNVDRRKSTSKYVLTLVRITTC